MTQARLVYEEAQRITRLHRATRLAGDLVRHGRAGRHIVGGTEIVLDEAYQLEQVAHDALYGAIDHAVRELSIPLEQLDTELEGRICRRERLEILDRYQRWIGAST